MTVAGYVISTDPTRLDVSVIHEYLTRSYWAAGIPRSVVERAIAGSLCFGLYHGSDQVGFARIITDSATYAYLADVFVLEPHRGRGLAKWLMDVIIAHPALQGLRRWASLPATHTGCMRAMASGRSPIRSGTWRSTEPTPTPRAPAGERPAGLPQPPRPLQLH
jgi:GNAT superfamily N-acetyltransferase